MKTLIEIQRRVAYTPVEARTLPKGRLVELDAVAAIWFEEKSKLFDGPMPLGCDSRLAIPGYLCPYFLCVSVTSESLSLSLLPVPCELACPNLQSPVTVNSLLYLRNLAKAHVYQTVLDASLGRPAEGVQIQLQKLEQPGDNPEVATFSPLAVG
jgi:hypothetical protein